MYSAVGRLAALHDQVAPGSNLAALQQCFKKR
jgi:hypothetical protein